MKNDDNKYNFTDRPKANFSSDSEKQRNRVDYPRKAYREEYGAEVAPPTAVRTERSVERSTEVPEKHEADRVMESTGKVAGYMGLAFGIASLFMWSIVLGPAAAVLGYYAYVNGRKTAGAWSIGLGIVATLSYFFMIPFAR
ncbi:hypothetical protein C0Q44_27660 [Paenibacillus sp. PCH8]|uniref:hypothetical protein n=1 Tax=Paenibacillus sp. PCH8 TaxID=2066524 RepID=UPI000CF8D809|nr:hypothetical protein [Paenibacillus sp. PCH8]PQP80546.1 hypothetical protein C0Q44_27660 [Paenibacillus sp. PCH8]